MNVLLEWLKPCRMIQRVPKALARGLFAWSAAWLMGLGPGFSASQASTTCGDGVCDAGETKQTCPQDCRLLLKRLRQRREGEERLQQPAGRRGAEALGPGDAQESLTVQGRARTYLLHAPPSSDGAGAMPLVLVFHIPSRRWGTPGPRPIPTCRA